MFKDDLVFPGEPVERVKNPSELEFPGGPVVRVKDPSALEFPEVPRAQTKGVKHDLEFPGGGVYKMVHTREQEARESKSAEASEASEAKSTHSGTETLEYSLESGEEHQESGSYLCASPRPGRVFARFLTAVAAFALAGLALVAVRPSAGRFRPVLAVPALAVASVVAGVVACGSR